MPKATLALLVALSLLSAPAARCDTSSDKPTPHYPPEYYAARRQMLAGILITSIGGGIGAMLTLFGLLTDDVSCGRSDGEKGCGTTLPGLGILAISAAVGVPQIILGASEKNRIRRGLEPSAELGSTSLRLAYFAERGPGVLFTQTF